MATDRVDGHLFRHLAPYDTPFVIDVAHPYGSAEIPYPPFEAKIRRAERMGFKRFPPVLRRIRFEEESEQRGKYAFFQTRRQFR